MEKEQLTANIHKIVLLLQCKKKTSQKFRLRSPREGLKSRVTSSKYPHFYCKGTFLIFSVMLTSKGDCWGCWTRILQCFLLSVFLLFLKKLFLLHQKKKYYPRSNIFQFPKTLHFVRKIDPLKYFHSALKISGPNITEEGPKICLVSKPLHCPSENVEILCKIVSLFPYLEQKLFSLSLMQTSKILLFFVFFLTSCTKGPLKPFDSCLSCPRKNLNYSIWLLLRTVLLSRTRSAGGWEDGHDPAMCPWSPESQLYPVL